MMLPLFIDMTGKKVLIIGGGKIALRRGKILAETGAEITLLTPERENGWENIAKVWLKDTYHNQNLVGYDLVLVATNDRLTNEAVAKKCAEKHILCNNATAADHGDVIFPAILHHGGFTAAITSNGKTPFLTAKLKNEIAQILEAYDEETITVLGEIRDHIIKNYPENKEAMLHRLANLPIQEIRGKGDIHALTDWLQREQISTDSDRID